MATVDLTGVRKSAILLQSLGQDQAAEILRRLPPESVEEVSREIASLTEISLDLRKDRLGFLERGARWEVLVGPDHREEVAVAVGEGLAGGQRAPLHHLPLAG